MAYNEGVILGTVSLNLTGSGNTSIGSTSNSGTISVGNASSTNVNILGPVNINSGGTRNTAIASGSNSGTVSIGNSASTAVTVLGPTNINTTGTLNTAINSTSNSGLISIGNSASGAITITTGSAGNFSLVGNGHTVSIANDAAANTLNLGTTNTTATTNINAGSGKINFAGTITASPVIPVAAGGTGAGTLTGVLTGNGTSAITANAVTQHGVLLAGASNAVSSTGVGATGTVLIGTTGADASFSATPTVTSVTFGAGSALSTFTDWTAWTPTYTGASTAGSTVYAAQTGHYSRIGNIVVATFILSITSATGTGNALIGGFPFAFNNADGYFGSILTSAVTWPASTTHVTLAAVINSTTATIFASGSAQIGSNIQMANSAQTFEGTITYRV